MKLAIPYGDWLRPTLARVKKTVFDVIGKNIKNIVLADIFAGTGNLGIEALSMGASHVIFVESRKNACDILKKNLEKLGYTEEYYSIICNDALKSIDHQLFLPNKLDLIFIDPPYRISAVLIGKIFDSILLKDILKEKGEIVFFMFKKRMPEFEFKDFEITWQKNIGITTLTFLRNKV